MTDQQKRRRSRGNKADHIPLAEWLVSAVGLVLVLSSLGFLLYKGLVFEQLPPRIDSQLTRVSEAEDGFLAKIALFNRGGETVADLVVWGELAVGNGETVRREVTIDYLPGHSSREIGMFFPKRPSPSTLRITAISYEAP